MEPQEASWWLYAIPMTILVTVVIIAFKMVSRRNKVTQSADGNRARVWQRMQMWLNRHKRRLWGVAILGPLAVLCYSYRIELGTFVSKFPVTSEGISSLPGLLAEWLMGPVAQWASRHWFPMAVISMLVVIALAAIWWGSLYMRRLWRSPWSTIGFTLIAVTALLFVLSQLPAMLAWWMTVKFSSFTEEVTQQPPRTPPAPTATPATTAGVPQANGMAYRWFSPSTHYAQQGAWVELKPRGQNRDWCVHVRPHNAGEVQIRMIGGATTVHTTEQQPQRRTIEVQSNKLIPAGYIVFSYPPESDGTCAVPPRGP